jgi:hypothetical protein
MKLTVSLSSTLYIYAFKRKKELDIQSNIGDIDVNTEDGILAGILVLGVINGF